jgi:hypothetical protein
MAELVWNNASAWERTPIDVEGATGKRRGAASVLPEAFELPPNVIVEQVEEAIAVDEVPTGAKRSAPPNLIDVSIEAEPGIARVIALRHPSGAITFHSGEGELTRRGKRSSITTQRFRIHVREAPAGPGRRGVARRLFKIVVLKVLDLIADATLPAAVRAWEKRTWKNRGLREGWVRISEEGLRTGALEHVATMKPSSRALLLLHGTFSHTAGSFRDMLETNFLSEARALYGDEIYGFDHFTLGKTPEENARDLLSALPDGPQAFDVVTYSRGGLVMRTAIERASTLEGLSSRFQLGHAVLVASPNQGTPLATPKRWRDTIGWLATILDHFPDTPLVTGASFVGESIVWLASHLTRAAPGLDAMDGTGPVIGDLQASSSPAPGAYSALVANHIPEPGLAQKLIDVSADMFFGTANDLVVPSEGGWLVDAGQGLAPVIAQDMIGCFGPGGNLAPDTAGINHLHLFRRPETARFLLNAFRRLPQQLDPIDVDMRLPLRPARHDARLTSLAAAFEPDAGSTTMRLRTTALEGLPQARGQLRDHGLPEQGDTLNLVVMSCESESGETIAQLYAQYAGARLIVPFRTRGGDDGKRWQRIIALKEEVRTFADSAVGGVEPSQEALRELGGLLFDTLLPDRVRRLYDTARSRESDQVGTHLNVILTSQIAWVADIPWEFAFDHSQRSQLATEEVHFIRNALTDVPAEQLDQRPGPLRMLVVVSQPVDAGYISADEEEAVILSGFQPLIDAGLADVDILRSVTTAGLHEKLLLKNYDVLHFIGHGEFDEKAQTGRLMFEDGEGRREFISVQDLRRILRGRGLQMVFLNACQTGRGGSALFARGIAWELVDVGIHCVVANQYSVLNSSATEFAQTFYWLLAMGWTIGAAAREARIAVNYAMQRETIDWAVPVVYARNPDSQLSMASIPRTGATSRVAATGMRRRVRADVPKPITVAVCDMGGKFGRIQPTLDHLNSVQDRFRFEFANVTAPVGVLQNEKDRDTQLNADVAANRLCNLPGELGVDYVYCLTRYPLTFTSGDEVMWNYYNWWPDEDGARIIIGSIPITAADPAHLNSSRAITNLLVQGLIGILTKVGTHDGGSKSCPLYMNSELDPNLVDNTQKLDAACRKKLLGKMPDELPSLEAMLRAFV